jgi:adenosylhomocysteine nucleosidase
MTVSDASFDDPCIFFALGRESRPFTRQFDRQRGLPQAPCPARFFGRGGLNVLVVETGTGLTRTESALRWLLSRPEIDHVPYRPRFILSAGFAGALRSEIKIGDIILADEVTDSARQIWKTTWPGEIASMQLQPHWHRGRLFTAKSLVGRPEEKQGLGLDYDAVAVDMESAVAAHLCTEAGIPFGCVRAISDEADAMISPQIVKLLARERVSLRRVIAEAFRRPGRLPEFRRLARDTRKAGARLAEALLKLISLPGQV